MPICLIDQPAGLGDICFIQKLIDRVISDGYDAVLPVIPAYSWLGDYIHKDRLRIVPQCESLVVSPPNFFLPLKLSGQFYPHMSVIAAKYHMLRMNYDNWQDHFTFRRFPDKEEALFRRLGLQEGQRYNLASLMIKSPPESRQVHVTLPFSELIPTVFVSQLDGFTPFDWAYVFERAEHIAIVDSCFTFICEKLNLQAKSLTIISRAHEEGGVHESLMTLHMFKQPWKPLPPAP